MSRSNWQWILDMNPDAAVEDQRGWYRDIPLGEPIPWACANPACVDEHGVRTVFERTRGKLRGTSEYCPRCEAAIKARSGRDVDPSIQAAVDKIEASLGSGFGWGYRWNRERINPKLASRWLDQFKE